jgi:hypothetical protein
MTTQRYETIIDTDDAMAERAASELFTDVRIEPLFESAAHSSLSFNATRESLVAYADRFGLPHDELDDVFTSLD